MMIASTAGMGFFNQHEWAIVIVIAAYICFILGSMFAVREWNKKKDKGSRG